MIKFTEEQIRRLSELGADSSLNDSEFENAAQRNKVFQEKEHE